jgi:hypothetical protein
MAPLPLLKLAGLLVKTLAKPVANRVKVEATRHPRLSLVCTSVGQLLHQVTSRINVMAQGYKVLNIDPLPEEEGENFYPSAFRKQHTAICVTDCVLVYFMVYISTEKRYRLRFRVICLHCGC